MFLGGDRNKMAVLFRVQRQELKVEGFLKNQGLGLIGFIFLGFRV